MVSRCVVQRILFSTVMVCMLVQFCLPASSQDVFQMAMNVYRQKRYAEAGEAFQKITIISPQNVDAYIYSANCWYMQGQADKAIRAYWYIFRAFPNNGKAYALKEYLRKIDREYNQHFNDKSYACFGDKKASAETGRSNSLTSSLSSSKDIVEDLVKTVRPLKNRPEISKGLIDRAKSALREYPNNLLSLVHRKGCRIHLTPTMIDKEPGLEHTTPPGYMEGHSFKDCPGMFYSGGIVICEFTIGNGFDWEPTADPIGTLRHELGHAVDWYLGQISETPEYKHAYLLDSGAIRDDSVRNKLAYYLQKDTRGQHECFAELMCARYGGRDGRQDETTDLLASCFPLTLKVIDKRIAEAN